MRDYDWSEEKILDDLKNEVIPKTKEAKNWTEWKTLLEKWTEDVYGWEKTERSPDDINSEVIDEHGETHYNGYKFRSSLIARWTVFFDSYGIEYEYVLDEIVLGNEKSYLPDFYIPSLELYVEVKPNKSLNLSELKKIESFSLDWDNNLLLIMGIPSEEEMLLLNRCSTSPLSEYIDEDCVIKELDVASDYIQNVIDFS